jgi:hypothetical protein
LRLLDISILFDISNTNVKTKMKIGFLAFLVAAQSAAAFHVQAPKTQGTALKSSFSGVNGGTSVKAGDKPIGAGSSGSLTSGPGKAAGVGGGTLTKNIWDIVTPTTVQGASLRTWSVTSPSVERVQVFLKTDGRPLNANVELWHGPDNTPQKMGVYVEDGSLRTFNAVIETPRGHNSVAIRNTGPVEFPLYASMDTEIRDAVGDGSAGLMAVTKTLSEKPKVVQGGAVQTYPFEPAVASVQILLKTDGRPLNARIELLQGPNNNKQVIELYTEDGLERPFYAVFETPGVGNVIRIVNTAPVEFPLHACVEPYLIQTGPLSGGDWDGGIVLDAI